MVFMPWQLLDSSSNNLRAQFKKLSPADSSLLPGSRTGITTYQVDLSLAL